MARRIVFSRCHYAIKINMNETITMRLPLGFDDLRRLLELHHPSLSYHLSNDERL